MITIADKKNKGVSASPWLGFFDAQAIEKIAIIVEILATKQTFYGDSQFYFPLLELLTVTDEPGFMPLMHRLEQDKIISVDEHIAPVDGQVISEPLPVFVRQSAETIAYCFNHPNLRCYLPMLIRVDVERAKVLLGEISACNRSGSSIASHPNLALIEGNLFANGRDTLISGELELALSEAMLKQSTGVPCPYSDIYELMDIVLPDDSRTPDKVATSVRDTARRLNKKIKKLYPDHEGWLIWKNKAIARSF